MNALEWRGPVLVTGAGGFIGRRVVARLLQEGVGVRALLLPDEAAPAEWTEPPNGVKVVRGDICDPDAVRRALDGTDRLIHLAALVGDWGAEAAHRRVTVGGTETIFRAAADAGVRCVLASSIVVYGDALGRDVCHEEHPPGRACGAYGRAKQAQEQIARGLERERGLQLSVVRPANVFGPGSGPWVRDLCAQLRSGLPTLIGGGDYDAGLTYVDNVADLLVRAAGHPAAVGRIYNANDDHGVTWRRYCGDLAEMIGAHPPRSLPRWLANAAAGACEAIWRRAGWRSRPPVTREALNLVGSRHRVPIERARRELGYEPRIGYAEGLAAVAASLR